MMKKLEDYLILDLDYESPDLVAPEKWNIGEGLPSPYYEFALLSLNRSKVEKAKQQLSKFKSDTSFIKLYSSPEPKVDKQSFLIFLEEQGEKIRIKPTVSLGVFDKEPYLKHLISHQSTNKMLLSDLAHLQDFILNKNPVKVEQAKTVFKQFSETCNIILNLISSAMLDRFTITSSNSNLIDILKSKHQYNELYHIYEKTRGRSKKMNSKDGNTSKIPISKAIMSFATASSVTENLRKIDELRKHKGYRLFISEPKLSIDLKLSGTPAELLLNLLAKHLQQTLSASDDFFEPILSPDVRIREFTIEWMSLILDFLYFNYGMFSNRKKGYMEPQVIATSVLLKAHGLLPQKFDNFKLNPIKNWMEELLPVVARPKLKPVKKRLKKNSAPKKLESHDRLMGY